MSLSCTKVRVYASGFSFAVKAYIYRNGKNVTSNEHGAEIDQELERLTFYGFPKVLDFLEKELFGIHNPRSFGKSNVNLGSNYLQLMLSVFKLVMQGSNQRELACGRYSPLNSVGRASDCLIRNRPGIGASGCTLHRRPQSQAFMGNRDTNKCKTHRRKVAK
jgi:hypothetical protein